MFHGMINQLLMNSFGPISQEVVAKVAQYYEDNYEVNALADFAADTIFHVPSLEYISAIASASESHKAYLLRFVTFPEYMTGPYKGAVHGVDLAYIFDINIDDINKYIDLKVDASKWSDVDNKLKTSYGALVSSFVKTGKPVAGQASPEWPPFDQQSQKYMEFNES